eukprot:CAMPEP_0170648152 /NCGR_PEP_ID=MMETSP0224-20130122/44587_1 /TAXON_ID=285029 /ORGANISM="Togula jolla, Strain CCCM 725" /LENGTH=50 /DNA_ID=CAMNT_0010979669 /DNA_START=40 /DNA_END=188 /DNA_ORIENTATION=+
MQLPITKNPAASSPLTSSTSARGGAKGEPALRSAVAKKEPAMMRPVPMRT